MKFPGRKASFRRSLLSCGILLAASGITSAQQLEEITVTAQKREQSLQDVPVSVSAFDQEAMTNMSLRSVGDALDFSPNVMRAGGPSSGSDAFFFFRGVGQVDNSIALDPGVGVYIDEVYLGRLQGAQFELLDIQRTEILRGPQGTFFGRNTVGGAVSMTTKDPADEFGVEGQVAMGERDRHDSYLAVDMPITETLAMRVSGFSKNQDGWAESVYTGDSYGATDDQGGRLKVVWDAGETVTAKLSVDYTDGFGTQLPTSILDWNMWANSAFVPDSNMVFLGNSALQVPFPNAYSLYDENGVYDPNAPVRPENSIAADIDPDPFDDEIYVDAPGYSDTDRGGAAVSVDWDAPLMSIKSITATRFVNQLSNSDLDGGGYTFYNAEFLTDQEQYSQEFQFSGTAMDDDLTWLAGLYWFKENITGATELCLGTGEYISDFPVPEYTANGDQQAIAMPINSTTTGSIIPSPHDVAGAARRMSGHCIMAGSQFDLTVESYATFGQFEYAFDDQWTGVLGFRYTEDTKDQNYTMWFRNTGNPPISGTSVSLSDYYAANGTLPTDYGPVGSFIPALPANGQALAPYLHGGTNYFLGPNVPGSDKYNYVNTWENFSPTLRLQYQWTDDVQLYTSWSNGFKSGGFSGRATPGEPIAKYNPEEIQTFELGAKSELFDSRVRVNGAAFYSLYDDVQLLVLDAELGSTAPPIFATVNGGEAEIMGMELEVQGMVTENLMVNGGLGYIHNEWKSLNEEVALNYQAFYNCLQEQQGCGNVRYDEDTTWSDNFTYQPSNTSGGTPDPNDPALPPKFNAAGYDKINIDDKLPNTPEWTFNLGAQYTFYLAEGAELTFRTDYSYVSEVAMQAENDPGEIRDAYDLVNARAIFAPTENVRVAIYATNLLDEEYYWSLFDQREDLGVLSGTAAPGREVGMEVHFNF